MTSKTRYNQVANYIYLDTQINKAIGDDAPCEYFGRVLAQCGSGNIELGNIATQKSLFESLAENAIPNEVVTMNVEKYDLFLSERRKMMAELIEKYYKAL